MSWVVTVLSGACVAWTAFTVASHVAVFSKLFMSLGAELPLPTRVVVFVGRSLVVWPVALAAIALLVVKELRPLTVRTKLLIDIAVFFTAAIVAAMISEALFQPMLTLIQQVG